MVLAIAAYYVVIGAVDVLAVVIAVELLGKSEAYAGFVTTAAGFGCVLAGGIGVAVIGRRWISPWILGAALATRRVVGRGVVGRRARRGVACWCSSRSGWPKRPTS